MDSETSENKIISLHPNVPTHNDKDLHEERYTQLLFQSCEGLELKEKLVAILGIYKYKFIPST